MNIIREYNGFKVLQDSPSKYYVSNKDGEMVSAVTIGAALDILEDLIVLDLEKTGQYRVLVNRKFYLVNVQGFMMLLNFRKGETMMTSHILKYGVYEGPETAFVKHFLKPGMVCMDVGAHIGYHTLLMASLVGKNGKVHSFEVDRKLMCVLMDNVWVNRIKTVSWYGSALSDVDGVVKYVTGNSILSNDDSGIECASWTADSFARKYRPGKIDFVKIDTSGYDCKVLSGMRGVIERNPNIVIMMEYNPSLFALFGSSNDDLLGLLNDYGMGAVFLTGDRCVEKYGFGLFNPIEPKEYLSSMRHITKVYSSDPDREVLSLICAKPDVLRRVSGGAEVVC